MPEVLVRSHKDKVLHILAYVREESSLTTYTDTIFLFREKMVDFMVPGAQKKKFQGWTKPRVLSSESYYRFTNNHGLDSVSNTCNYHFSWSDWMRLPALANLPAGWQEESVATDTVTGRYGVAEIWNKNDGRVKIDVDVTADTLARRWVADFKGFFRNNIDFDKFDLHLDYDNVMGDCLLPSDLESYSYNIESYGRGHTMFGFNHWKQPYFVSTNATVYIVDREFITAKEALKRQRYRLPDDNAFVYRSPEAPELEASIQALISRVNDIDQVSVRINDVPDIRLSAAKFNTHIKPKPGEIILQVLKSITGIDQMQRDRETYKENNRWKRYSIPENLKNR